MPRVIATICLEGITLVEGGYRGQNALVGYAFVLAWPFIIRFGIAKLFPSRKAAELMVILDFIVVGYVCLFLGGAQIFAANAFVIVHANSIIIGGPRLLAWAYAIVAPTCIVAHYAGLIPSLRGPTSIPAAILGLAFGTLYVSAIAWYSWRWARRASQRKNALKELSANLESLVAQRTAALASTNAAISRFVPQEFLRSLGHEDVTTARLGDASMREVTILFADIRNFTTLSECLTPEETFRFLNNWYSRIGPHIRMQSGFVDKYIGDGVMALFPRSPADAVRAALAMQCEVRAQNEVHTGQRPIAIGIGIHVGRVMMGTIGEEQRFEATVISDAVNLTARLESLTKKLGCTVLITMDVAGHLSPQELLDSRFLGAFAMKGKTQAIGIQELFAADFAELREAKATSREPFSRALDLYRQGNVIQALGIVRELSDRTPDDGPMAWWRARMENDSAFDESSNRHEIVRLDEK